jgi:hypothetical protein
MTTVLFTTDTEFSFRLHKWGKDPVENFRIAIMGEVPDGAWGIGHQMKRLNSHGLKGVFFVEALSSELFGIDLLKRVVDPILTNGHEVQLHLHTEWLNWIEKDVVGSRRGANIADFDRGDQRRLLEIGVEALTRAGAPTPIAFRAGNFGANNDTLKALRSLGIQYDSSYNRPYLGKACRIDTAQPLVSPTALEGLIEVPPTYFEDFPGGCRPLQIAAASSAELRAVTRQAIARQLPTMVVVSHSFELIDLARVSSNRLLLRRFDEYCAALQGAGLVSSGFRDLNAPTARPEPSSVAKPLTSNPVRTALRMIEQSVGSYLYNRNYRYSRGWSFPLGLDHLGSEHAAAWAGWLASTV